MSKSFEGGPEPKLVYEDDEVLGVYKPCLLHSSPLEGGGPDLCAWLFSQRPDLAFDSTRLRGPGAGRKAEGGLFHRLDYETSGLVLFAKSEAVLEALLGAQEEGRIAKDYRAICLPSQDPQPGARPERSPPAGIGAEAWFRAIDFGMMTRAGLEALASLVSGRGIECHFRPYGPRAARVACLALGIDSPGKGGPDRPYASTVLGARPEAGEGRGLVLDLRIHRGFRHQLRAQLAWLGLPIRGDALYGSGAPERLFLEARTVTLDLAGRPGPLVVGLDPREGRGD